jgi:hypothetical protein
MYSKHQTDMNEETGSYDSDKLSICKLRKNLSTAFDVSLTVHLSITSINEQLNTLRTGDADLRLYITTVQDG